jgi:hypothetical protein
LQYIAVNSKSLREKPLFPGCAQKFVNGVRALKALFGPDKLRTNMDFFGAGRVFPHSRKPGRAKPPDVPKTGAAGVYSRRSVRRVFQQYSRRPFSRSDNFSARATWSGERTAKDEKTQCRERQAGLD